jgi:5-methylcytosine-specific restriction endonuclease McrBC GTP-binding regulatory subunit McrB
MARPATGQTPVKTFRPPIPLWEEVMKYVKAEKRPYADVVIEALHDWLKKKDRERPAADATEES